jgi:uncharacterized protein with HEPN domain
MKYNERDMSYLWDIQDACNDIITFIDNIKYPEFENSKMIRFAVERQLLVIGEAANHLSEECRKNETEIPWKLLIGLRNIIAHEYGEILVERIFKIAVNDVPQLFKIIRGILDQ